MKAILAHLYLAWIHPFGDGNGRTSRLIEVHVLTHAGVPMPAAHLMSNHYNSTRSEYYRQLDQAHQSGGDFRPFLSYAVRGFVDGLREQIAMIKKEQLEAAWRDYVHSKFRNLNSRTARRRELLVLALSLSHAGVPRTKISMLTPSVAAAYAGATTKMLTRDLNALDKMGLVKKQADGYRANRNRMLAFRPHRKPASN
jgi:Fic family protein